MVFDITTHRPIIFTLGSEFLQVEMRALIGREKGGGRDGGRG